MIRTPLPRTPSTIGRWWPKPNGERAVSPVWHFRTDFLFPPELGSMVYVPEGEFMMGVTRSMPVLSALASNLPLHAVWLSAFWLDKHEITNLEYRAA